MSGSVGAFVLAGVQLASIEKIASKDWGDLALAALGAGLCLLAVCMVVGACARLLSDRWIGLAQLGAEQFVNLVNDRAVGEEVFDQIAVCGEELYGSVAGDLPDLYRRIVFYNEKSRSGTLSKADAKAAAALRAAADNVVNFANYCWTRQRFSAICRRLSISGCCLVLGVMIFSFAVGGGIGSALL